VGRPGAGSRAGADPSPAGRLQVELAHGTADEAYLQQLEGALQRASAACPKPDLIVYIAGAAPAAAAEVVLAWPAQPAQRAAVQPLCDAAAAEC
jgi:hypothetical protein